MEVLNQTVLDNFCLYLREERFSGKIQDLKLEYCNEDCEYIYLVLIKIKKSQRNKGYGSVVLSEVINIADKYNVQIKLYPTENYGSDLRRLYGFYRKFGFVLIKKNKKLNYINNYMIYYPNKKIRKNIGKLEN